jgi:aryl-alcohol dehydrogenase-like predicted oxidoreductase
VSRIAFGCEAIGGTDWGRVDESESLLAVAQALEKGINFFDTADVYGLGHSESILRKALGARRKNVIIATKFGVNWQADPQGGRAKTFFDSSPGHLVEALDSSLRRLDIDCVPLYQIHWPDPNTPIADTLEALLRARDAGKIKHIGVSNFSIEQVSAAVQFTSLGSVQISYSLLNHETAAPLANYCASLGTGVIAYGALAQGLLSGKYGTATIFGSDDRRSRLTHFRADELKRNLVVVEALQNLAAQYQKSPAQIAIRWVLEQSPVSCVTIGIKTMQQVEENSQATHWTLTDEHQKYLGSLIKSAAFVKGRNPVHD